MSTNSNHTALSIPRRVALLLAAVLLVTACDKPNQSVSDDGVDELVQNSLNAIADGEADDAYLQYFTKDFRLQMPEADWLPLAQAYQQRLGKVLTIKRTSGMAAQSEGVGREQFCYEVTWEKGSGQVLAVVFNENETLDEQGWKLASLTLRSPALEPSTPTTPLDPNHTTLPPTLPASKIPSLKPLPTLPTLPPLPKTVDEITPEDEALIPAAKPKPKPKLAP